MNGIIDWAGARARMIMAFIVLTLVAGAGAYVSLPKEGEPDIEIPMLFISVPFPGISAEDSEKLLVKPMETVMSDLDGLDRMLGTAAEGYGGLALEFEFGWDKTKIMADVRDRMTKAEADFPTGADSYSINEVNFSAFPIIIVNLTGPVPERTLVRLAKDMQDRLEGLEPVLEATLTGQRDEMLEVVIDPLRLESYNVTAAELVQVVTNNNQLIAAGDISTDQGAFALKIPSSFDEQADVMRLPVKVNGDRVVTLGDLADIRLTFEDREGTARFNGQNTVALQVVKRKGFPVIDTAALVRDEVAAEVAAWPEDLRAAVQVGTSNDQSTQVASMVSQLEGSVLTAIALVMIVVLASLGTRSALLVGFSIPTSFLLCFIFLGIMDITISNMVMFGLILAVGMLVDGAIVVVEYADRRINEGSGPMAAYLEAAKRMFWPVVSSTATTLCAFLPMLFWPGVAGEFMGMLPVTIIFVLSASLIVALIYLPVMGGVAGRISRLFDRSGNALARRLPRWGCALVAALGAYAVFVAVMQLLNPAYLTGTPQAGIAGVLLGAVLFTLGAALTSIGLNAATPPRKATKVNAGYRRSLFGKVMHALTGNPVMPVVTIAAVIFAVVGIFGYYGQNNNGTEFIGETEPEQAIIYVRARGNLSVGQKDALVKQVEDVVRAQPGVENVFAFAGAGGLNQNTGGGSGPRDTIGQVQVELIPWDDRPTTTTDGWLFFKDTKVSEIYDGDYILAELETKLARIPGLYAEIQNLSMGPASAKPVHLRLMGDNFDVLQQATTLVHEKFAATSGLVDVEDTLPLPGIDWQIDVDVEEAGRYGADVATVGGMIQLVTRGLLLDTMRVDSSDEEIEIRVRLPQQDRVLSTLDTLKLRTPGGLVPLSNFISREPVPKLAQIDRVDQQRYFDVKAAVAPDLRNAAGEVITPSERIAALTTWLNTTPLPAGVTWEWTGDEEEQAESMAFLGQAFAGALALMFIILLAQFNSFYNSVLVLLAVVLSTAGVLVGLLVMGQPFAVIMTGTGVVALAGIVVNNNIVLIDTYQEYSQYMPKLEAIVRTAENRIRPVLLTTITTMAGLAPMMFGLSLDFIQGGYSIDSPTAMFWKNLATAVVFGLGIATVLTLVFTPAMLALRIWLGKGAYRSIAGLRAWSNAGSRTARDLELAKAAKKVKHPEIIWDEAEVQDSRPAHLRAAE
ncbi:Multidrug resistance protein MdtC [Aquimixticola soesokkakensis]|uniref:Multidrug resistance protein MdtC n=1 Tax=Aquimixticola soesokkakensis TaxID=1519096 RepID=A0A1Y5SRB7_9RHOB|nr:efflux RND transporter permease subunit [Aquimixticola soesokkakensis]SLN45235.1 Multidrug resistance protein MdtC [Aquimixticola soesokkakensis]